MRKLILALILMPGIASAGPLRDAAWIGGAAVLDLGSTRYALERCPNCYEANPLMRSPSKALLVKAGTSAAGVFICDRLRKSGHPRAAKVMRWAIVGAWTGLALQNMHKR